MIAPVVLRWFEYKKSTFTDSVHSVYMQAVKPQLPSRIFEDLRCLTSDRYFIPEDEESDRVPFSCSFCKVSSLSYILGVTDENGHVILYNTNKTGDEGRITDWHTHNNAVFDLAWLEKEEKVLTASGDQTVILWDVRNKKELDTFKGHTGAVRSVCLRKHDNAVFATASQDGNILVWDTRCNRKDRFTSTVSTIRNAHILPSQSAKHQRMSHARKRRRTEQKKCQHGLTTVIFKDDHLLASAGAADGCIKLWDIRKIYTDKEEPAPVYNFPNTDIRKRKRGFSHMCFDSTYTRLFASCTNDTIYMYDLAAYNPMPVCRFKGHINDSIFVKMALSPDDQFLLSGSGDSFAYIFQIGKPGQSHVMLDAHSCDVTGVAWSGYDALKLVTLSNDSTMRIWRYNPSITKEQAKDIRVVCGIAERTRQYYF